ncbi:MAG: hypothetical protein H7070_08505 [Saprospiraceae bacterium]|nr:hypothetical protein [Pyrinomonadaceae bacterium]
MARIPIYQMALSYNSNNSIDLLFPSEQKNSDSQSFVYTLPVFGHRNYNDYLDLLTRHKIYFPISQMNDATEAIARLNNWELDFEIGGGAFTVKFALRDWGHTCLSRWTSILKKKLVPLNYVGEMQYLLPDTTEFVCLKPVDLQIMDEAYLEIRAIFVGLCPNFGRLHDDMYVTPRFDPKLNPKILKKGSSSKGRSPR